MSDTALNVMFGGCIVALLVMRSCLNMLCFPPATWLAVSIMAPDMGLRGLKCTYMEGVEHDSGELFIST